MNRIIVTIVFLLTMTQIGKAQEDIFALGLQLGIGARALAMGGAYTAVGGDYSASYWNPAALAAIKRIEVYGSLNHFASENNTSLLDNAQVFSRTSMKDEADFTKLNDFGMAYVVPTIQGSLVLSFGFNRVKSYDSHFDFGAFNYTSDDSVSQAWNEIENGSLNTWVLAGAIDVSPKISLGMGLNFWTGGSEFQSTFREDDVDNIYTDFDNFTREDNLDNEISGFNVKLGALYRINQMLKFGATITTPVTYKVKEDWSLLEEITDDDGYLVDEYSDEGAFEYKIRSPWTFSTGASVSLLNFVFAGDLEFIDWSQIEYKSEPPVEGISENQANREIRENYQSNAKKVLGFSFPVNNPRIRLGAEFTLPLTGLSFRAGYFRDPSIYKNASLDEDKQFYSAGLGFLLDKQIKLDIAYVHGFWKRFNSGLDIYDSDRLTDVGDYVEEIKVNKLLVSLAFRL